MNRIRTQFALAFCLLALLPLLAFGLLGYEIGAGHLRQEQEAKLVARGDREAALINSWIGERLGDARLAAGSIPVADYLGRPSPAKLPTLRRRLADYAASEPVPYVRVYVVSTATGRIVASSRPADEGLAARPCLQGWLHRPGRAFVSPPFQARPPAGPFFIDVAAAVAASPRGARLGCVVAEADLSRALIPVLLDRTGLGRSGESFLVDVRGLPLTPLRYKAAGAVAPWATVPVRTALEGGRNIVWSKDYRGVPVAAATARLPVVGWGVVVKQDQSELLAPIEQLRWLLLAVAGGTLVVAVMVAYLLAARFTRPLVALARASRRLARGEADVAVEEAGAVELSDTAAAFNHMARELAQARGRIEALAREAQERAAWLAGVLEQLPVGVIIAAAPDGRFVITNRAIEEQWGRATPEGARLGTTKEHFGYWRPDGSDYPEDEIPLYRAIHGESVRGEEMLVERGDGSRVHVMINAAPLREGGKVVGAVLAQWDVTAERRTQARLAEAKERIEELARREESRANWLTTVLDQLPVGVVIGRAPDGRITQANRAAEELWGRPTVYVSDYGLHYLRPNGEPVADRDIALARAIIRGERVVGDEYVLERPDGRRVGLRVNAAPLVEDGHVVGGVAAFWDVTAERETQRRLEEASRAKDEFLSLASHELKTPVTSIRLFCELAARHPERVQPKLLQNLLRQSAQLTQLINDLLDVSRLQLGRMPIEMRPLDLNELLADICERRRQVVESHIVLCLAEEAALKIEGDPVRLEQVFTNLVDNAVKYSPKGSRIRLRAHRLDGKALVEVADQGIGISPEHMPHIFERFYKPGPQQAAYTGLGVGLFISRQVVERHNGRIWAESEGEGKGSRFYVELPLAG